MRMNLIFIDGTVLKDVILSTTRHDLSIGKLRNKEELVKWLESDGNTALRMYFGGSYVQGGISHPKVIKSYEIIEDDESTCTLICNCGMTYNYIPTKCKKCDAVFVDC